LAYAVLAKYTDLDAVVQHESDLRTSKDVVEALSAHADGNTVVAGWPTLRTRRDDTVFYDIWAYRGLDGEHFTPYEPFHPDYRKDAPFEVGSVGSVWFAPFAAWVNQQVRTEACVELCRQWRRMGLRVLVVPWIAVEQPRDLWVAS
jgi:hypothetical protein